MKKMTAFLAAVFLAAGCTVTTSDGKKVEGNVASWMEHIKSELEASKNKQAPAVSPTPSSSAPTQESLPGPKNPPLERGSRRISIQVNLPEDGNFVNAFASAKSAGLQDVILSQDWTDFETGKGEYKPNPNWLEIANAYYPTQNVPLHLMIRPIHTNQKVLPKDLKGRSFDDPEVIARFNQMLDWALAQVRGSELVSLSIGSELDIYLQSHPKEWAAYETFFRQTADHARNIRPGLKIAAEMTFPVFTGRDRERALSLNRYADIIGVSYYPTDGLEQKARLPETVHKDMAAVADLAQGKPIIYYQFGYPSGTRCGSSEARQAEFIRQSFQAWDRYRSQVYLINFTWMFELSPDAVLGYTKYYQFDNPGFRDFLGSLGLKTWKGGGADKPAWKALKEESASRGW